MLNVSDPAFLNTCAGIVAQYDQKRAAMLPLLRLCQEREGYVTPEAEQWVGEYLGVPLVHVREVVSFYTLYFTKPAGRYVIDVCRTTSCWLRGGEGVIAHLEHKLGIRDGQTTPDGRYTLRTVECLCACEIAPMMQVNDAYHGPLTEERVDRILAGLPS